MATPAAILSILVQAQGIAKTSAQLEKIDRTAKKTADSTANLDKKFSSLDRSVGDFNRTMSAARNTVQLVKFPALIAGAGMAAQAVGALAAGAVSLGSALAPLAGVATAYAAGLTAVGQATGVAKLATIGLEDAISGQKGAMDKLSPVQRALVKDIRALKKETQGLRGDAQRGLLPGLDKALETVTPLIKQLRPVVKGTAEAMGDLAVSGARVVRSWGPDLQAVGKTNIKVIKNLGTAAIAAADGARHLVVAGGPLLTWLSEVAVKGAQWVRDQLEAGRESGRLAGFLEKTRDVMSTLAHIAVNLGAALFGIGKAAAPLGRDLLGLFEDLTKRFREWVESATGRNTLDDYFRAARQPILEVAGLIGDVGAAFLRLSQPGPESGGMIARLRELVPVLENVVASTTAAFGPVLIDALANVVRLFGQLAGTSGPLNVFVQLIGVLAGGLADLLSSNPALNTMVVSLVGFAGVVKALGLLSLVTGMTALTGAITGSVAAYRALAAGATVASVAQQRGVIATVAARAALLGAAAATAAYTAAQWLLNAALTANPIGIVIVGLTALGVAFVLAYTKVGAFRNAVNATFSWIKSNWPTVLAILTGPIGAAVLVIAKNWDTIKRAFQTGVTAMLSILRGAVGAITNAGKALGQGVINGFKSALNIAHEVAEAVRDTIAKAASFGIGIGRKLVEGIVNGIKSAAGSITGAVGSAAKDVAGAINPFGEGIGKKLGIVPMKAPGSLMGARPSMAPFAAVGAANGLHVSSGLRRGAITSSGNTSYHSTGEAVDLAGPPAGMLKTFRTLRSRFGSRLAELIYTPGGIGIKNGQPHTYTGQVAADHFDHVHVAFDTGIPGVGDGFGKAQAALFGGMGDGPGKLSLQQLANLWVKAGGSRKMAGLMARIAMAESHGDPTAKNPSGATGLWQILGGGFGNLLDPLTNARNAVAKYKTQGLGAWAASRSVWGQYVGHPGVTASTSARRAGAAAAGKINPYDLAIAQADVAIASAKGGKLGGVGGRRFSADMAKYYAILAKEKVIGARIRKIRGALKGKLTKGTRLRLTQELAQLLPEHRQLALDRAAIKRGPAPADTSAGADVSAGGGGDTGDPNQPLIDAINAAAEQQRQHDELIKQQIALQETIRDEQRKFNNVSTSNYNVLSKAIADVANRELGGGIGLGFMSPGYPGGGVRY